MKKFGILFAYIIFMMTPLLHSLGVLSTQDASYGLLVGLVLLAIAFTK